MKIIPQGYHVLIKPLKGDVTYGHLLLPDTAKAKPNNGVVMAKGQWCHQVEIGDWVVYSRKQAHDYITEHGEELIFIDERAIIVVLDNENI